jgi:heat shock protein 5
MAPRRALLLLAPLWWSQLLVVGGQDDEQAEEGPVVGIDLGTTYSCVGIYKNGRVEIIPNDQGNRITPSYVAFAGSERLVGEAAKNQATINPAETIYNAKRLIGRRFEEAEVQADIKILPFKVIDENKRPTIVVTSGGKPKKMVPEEVSAIVLAKMKTTAESYLGKEVKNAVVTVPAYFNDAQRQATKTAGSIAGLNVMRIVNEPTAAAIAFGLDKQKGPEKNILVFDLGGGTFDVSLLTLDSGVFEVLATNGDTHLGGEDFDDRVMNHLVTNFKKKYKKDPSHDKRAIAKLRSAVEKAKRALSSQMETRVDIEAFMDGTDFSEVLTRAKFEEINADLFKKTLGPVKQVLEDSGLKKQQVHDIVMVGGSTRIPKVQKLIKDFFDGKEPNKGVNPDEAVAFGAAVQGGILSGEADNSGLILLDVTPLTLGIETTGGIMSNIIPRNTVIPTKKTKQFKTHNVEDTTTGIRVYEGERPMTKDNHLLGEFTMTGFPGTEEGRLHEVTLSIDSNGILEVTDQIISSKKTMSITIGNDGSRLNEKQIEKMIREAEMYADEDRKVRGRADAKASLDQYIRSIEQALKDDRGLGAQVTDDERESMKDAMKEGRDWMDAEPEADVDDINAKKAEIEAICNPIIQRYANHGGSEDSEEDEDEDNTEL